MECEALHWDRNAEGEHKTEQICFQNQEMSDISDFQDAEWIQLWGVSFWTPILYLPSLHTEHIGMAAEILNRDSQEAPGPQNVDNANK